MDWSWYLDNTRVFSSVYIILSQEQLLHAKSKWLRATVEYLWIRLTRNPNSDSSVLVLKNGIGTLICLFFMSLPFYALHLNGSFGILFRFCLIIVYVCTVQLAVAPLNQPSLFCKKIANLPISTLLVNN